MKQARVWILLIAGLPVMGGAADKAASADGGQAFVAFYDKFVNIVDADQNDCAKMAGELDALLQANKAVLASGKAAMAAGKKLPAAAQQHLNEASKKIGPGAQKCGANPRVMSALRQLQN